MHAVTANGANIPALGFGTWDLRDDTAVNMVRDAIEIGYRHIDTAVMYGNEREVGEGIRQADLNRDELFLTTKIWPSDFEPAAFEAAVTTSLDKLGVDTVDLLLLHWPNPDIPLADTLGAICAEKTKGRTQHIGISNFTSAQVEEAVRICPEPIAVNQVEYHPYLSQKALLKTHARHGIALTAYCPIARGRVFEDEALRTIAGHHNKQVNQVVLRWLIQQDHVIAVPRTSSVEHARSNFKVDDFELSSSEMKLISECESADGRIVAVNNQGFAPDWD